MLAIFDESECEEREGADIGDAGHVDHELENDPDEFLYASLFVQQGLGERFAFSVLIFFRPRHGARHFVARALEYCEIV